MAKPNPSAEPSMEEILASIRRIISDDGAPVPATAPVAPRPAPVVAAEPPRAVAAPAPASGHVTEDDLDRLFAKAGSEAEDQEEEDDAGEVLELTEPEEPSAPTPAPIVEGLRPDESELAFVDPVLPAVEEAEAIAEAVPEPEPVRAPPPPPRPEPRAAKAPAEDQEPLVSPHTGASVNAAFGQLTHTILSANARTLDDLVKEMLRPMLKSWLDENLPAIVERLVRAEIERVSRGR